MPVFYRKAVEPPVDNANRRPALLCRLPVELLLEIARDASGRRDSYSRWVEWRRRMQALSLVCRYLHRALESTLCEVVWVSGAELAVDGPARALRPVRNRLGPLSNGKSGTRVGERVKWLRMDGLHHPPSGADLAILDLTPLPILETLELERCAFLNPSPYLALTSLWLDTVKIRPVDFARLITPAVTPRLNYLAIRSLADPDKVNPRHKDAPVVFFPDLPSDLVSRLGLLQVDLSDIASFPPNLFAHSLPVVLTWRFWHQTPPSLLFPTLERPPRHIQVGSICWPEARALWTRRTCERLLGWAKGVPLVRDGDVDGDSAPRTLILPDEFCAPYCAEDRAAGLLAQEVVLEGGRRGIRIEWTADSRWAEEKRLHGVLQRHR